MKEFSFKRGFYTLLFCILVFTGLNAQNSLDLVGLTASTPATSAYSLRKLSSSFVGKAIQVRRSSDNALQDIDFTTGGSLDTVSLKAFVGGDWYGNYLV